MRCWSVDEPIWYAEIVVEPLSSPSQPGDPAFPLPQHHTSLPSLPTTHILDSIFLRSLASPTSILPSSLLWSRATIECPWRFETPRPQLATKRHGDPSSGPSTPVRVPTSAPFDQSSLHLARQLSRSQFKEVRLGST